MPVDPNVFNNIKTYQDYKNAQDAVDLQRMQVGAALGASNVDTLTKQNVLKGQYLSAAAGTGDQGTWDATRQKLGGLGIDVSDVPPDVVTGANYANALKIAQSPYGALINGGKAISDMTGQIPPVLSGLIGGNTIPALKQAQSAPTSQALPNPQSPVNGAYNQNTAPTPPAAIVEDRAISKAVSSNTPTSSAPQNKNSSSISIPPKMPNETMDAYKLRLANDPNVIAAQEQAKQQGQIDAKRGAQALETSDMAILFNKVAKTASTFGGGAINSTVDSVTNALNIPTSSNINRAAFKADVSNLAMAMYRNMAATGRVTKAEGEYILKNLPDDENNNGVIIETANNHNQFYNDWMVKRGYDPVSGKPLQPGQQPNLVPLVDNPFKNAAQASEKPDLSAYKAGVTFTSPTGTYLFIGGDPTDKRNYKAVKGPK